MLLKKSILNYKNFLLLILGLFSFFINYYYGFIGIMPSDNTVLYNGGYKVLNGNIPFTDYWLVTGPLLDYLNAFFFLIFGVSWKTYIIHSSLVNLVFAYLSYYFFIKINLPFHQAFLYSILISLLFYPVVGTPFVDHHSIFFTIVSFYFFMIGIILKKFNYFFFIPLFFCLAFLAKQTPAVYGFFAISTLILFYFYYDKKNISKILYYLSIGSIASIFFIIIFFVLTKIKFQDFYTQYILYAQTIGEFRFQNYNFNLLKIILDFKFIIFLNFILILILAKIYFNRKPKDIKLIFIISTSLALSFVLIFHQYYTLNQELIFFLIPYITAIIHAYGKKVQLKKYFIVLSIFICLYASIKYHYRFNEHRKFSELEKVNIHNAINAKILSKDLNNLQWITYKYPDNPTKELKLLKEIMDIISSDQNNKMLITDYQFLAPVLLISDNSPNQWHHPTVSFPVKGQKYYNTYKNYFIKKIKKNNIKIIYETTEIIKNRSIIGLILEDSCFEKNIINELLVQIKLLNDCKDLK